MAKTAEGEIKNENVKANAKKEDPYRMVPVYLPRARSGEEPDLFVGHNGKGYLIKKGEEVMVPYCVAQVIYDSEKAARKRDKYKEELEKKAM